MRPGTLRAIAKRNDYALPDDLESLYRFRDFAHFIEVWILTTNALQTARGLPAGRDRLRRGGRLAWRGLSRGDLQSAERVARGVDWDEIFGGYCDGAQEARELHGVEVRLTPDIFRAATPEQAEQVVRYSAAVPRPRSRSRRARRAGSRVPVRAVRTGVLARRALWAFVSVPHAGEAAGARVCACRARRARRRSDPARHPLGRGSRAGGGARRPRHRPRRLPALEPPHRRRPRRSRSTRCRSSSPPASAARSRPTTRRCSTPT